MHVRLAEESDFTAIAAFLRPSVVGVVAPTADDLVAEWNASKSHYATVVAFVDDELAGFAKAMTFRTRQAYQWTAEIGVHVDERFHRRGVARALYARLIEVCRAQGFHSVVGVIALPNDASVALHQALGFSLVGTLPAAGFKGDWHDAALYWMKLGEDAAPVELKSPAEVA
jgi:phosphinothricin acetyltransferase